jgi:cellulose synthase/poly-beta-1,6-N-acetylglucosamine synthase-like glycosyltransferase
MSVAWIVGGVMFYISNERRKPLPLYKTPMVSILVPCYNEAETVERTVQELSKIQYPNYEIIAINDGSSDNTAEVIAGLLDKYEKLRFVDLKENNGKANALYLGLLASNGEILMGVDSDAYIMPDALNYIISKAEISYFKPLIYVISYEKVKDKLIYVNPHDKASLFSEEYKIENLLSEEFDVIDINEC